MSEINAKVKHIDDENWVIDTEGEHIELVSKHLSDDGISESGISNVIMNAAKTLAQCPNPKYDIENKKTGIVIGKVQSGKTSNFISTLALAFDNGYNLAIVLGGTKRNLLQQNTDRIESYFKKDNNYDCPVVLNTFKDKDLITPKKIKDFIQNKRKVIIVTLKHSKRINDLTDELFSMDFLKNQPLLIIDDEGDEYSLNSKVYKQEMSSTYAAIVRLLDCCKIRCFISVTATPQANVLISSLDILSPDFGILVKPGEAYCGLDTFHDVDSQYCIEITEEDSELLDAEGVPLSFYNALASFFIATTVHYIRTSEHKKLSMLIHPSYKVADLSNVYQKVENIVAHWRDIVENPDDIAFEDIENYLRRAFDQYKSSGVEMSTYEDIVSQIIWSIRNCGVHLITGNNPLNENDKFYANNIYVGGQMVGRGLTIKGLVITYIIRSAKGIQSVDTIQQRARWFGYKRDILDLCRIFATRKILNDFREIRDMEADLWLTIEENNLNGKNFTQMPRLFALAGNLQPTRRTVARTKKFAFNSWVVENQFQTIKEFIDNNFAVIKGIQGEYENYKKIKYYGDSFNVVYENLDFSSVVNNHLKTFVSPTESKCSIQFIEKIKDYLNNNNIDAKCDIVFPRYMNKYSTSKHYVEENGTIPNYMVGKRTSYMGDRYTHRGTVIEIQIHMIEDLNSGIISPTLAMYMPPNYIDKLINIITRDEDC